MNARLLLCLLIALLPAAGLAVAQDAAPLSPLPASAWNREAAAHLLRRAGFGGTAAEAESLHALGLEGAVDSLLDWEGQPDPRVPTPPIEVTARPGREELRDKTQEERQRITRAYRAADNRQYALIREWWMQTMIRTAHPARERLTLFWHGHFTSSYRDVRNSYHMFIQNTLLRRHAAGNFRELLDGISRDPAMLEYLDNNRNRKGQPNENYAREVMELFTLGVGNYTEKDIKEAARAFTGWTFVGNRFVFDRNQHDTAEKQFLGQQGAFDGAAVLDIILTQPAASRFLARKLFTYFAHAYPSDEIVEGLARTLRESDWELKPMLRRLFRSRSFSATPSVATRIKSPVELIVSLYRALGMDSTYAAGLSFLAGNLGQGLMDPPNVKGWAGGREWITTSNLLNRYNIAVSLVGMPEDKVRDMRNQNIRGMRKMMMEAMQRDPDSMEMGMEMSEEPAPSKKNKRGNRKRMAEYIEKVTFDVAAEARSLGLTDANALVDHYCRTLLAVPASPELRRTLLDYLDQDGGFRMDAEDAPARLHGLLRLIVSTPEFQIS